MVGLALAGACLVRFIADEAHFLDSWLSLYFVKNSGFYISKFEVAFSIQQQEVEMAFFNEASCIYTPNEVDFLRSCFTTAAIILEESGRPYSPSELAACVIKLYQCGLRERSQLMELAARLAHQKNRVREELGIRSPSSKSVQELFSENRV
ncbi:hypothetical protein [Brucella sp. NBRC 113783]|uniref:hypothetical protein n=1 Tax=Brucella sp. NBRC 113783 TaxID=3075478 RepID=UPI0029C0C2A6|nr:hypothetical protein [Brucella sp. NBRC 113783]MDX4075567.1 hypothetical protein [Brucella sp. NBRC 113783]